MTGIQSNAQKTNDFEPALFDHDGVVSGLEEAACPNCESRERTFFSHAQDDLTGKPGTFSFVTCQGCELVYQHPRIPSSDIGPYYDEEYIAHRKKTDFGWLTPFYQKAMQKHDKRKVALVKRFVDLNADSQVLDIGCAVGSFLDRVHNTCASKVSGVDFKDLADAEFMRHVDFHCGRLADIDFGQKRFDLITMWHFLEHDYSPKDTLERSRDLLSDQGRVVIEVPRLDSLTHKLYGSRWPGFQAPQHTACYSFKTLESMVEGAGLKVVDHFAHGAFPLYFYLFAGLAFQFRKGRGIDLQKAVLPYFLGQVASAPIWLLEKHLNLAMQTIVCERA